MFRVVMSPVLFPAAQGTEHQKARKKQVVMIAQKVMDANQTQHEKRSFIPSTNLRTVTFRALLPIINRYLDQSPQAFAVERRFRDVAAPLTFRSRARSSGFRQCGRPL